MKRIPPPECCLGYPWTQLERILTVKEAADLERWMLGQTQGICDGRRYDHETREYEHDSCGPHGAVVYGHDFMRWFHRLPVFD